MKLAHLIYGLIFTMMFNSVAQAEPPNLDLTRQKIVAYHDSGAYLHDISAVTRQATLFINYKTTLNQHTKHPKKLAIVLDIDETSLSNYDNMVPRQFVATKAQLNQEIMAANSPAIRPILVLYKDAIKHGVAVFFVTGRPPSNEEPTQKNLKKVGFTQWAGMYFKPSTYHNRSAIPYKSHARAEITHKGYTIIASIGDQYSDLEGGYTESKFKLPNPYYYLP